MAEITCIAGLPASGKSTWAQKHYADAVIVDDAWLHVGFNQYKARLQEVIEEAEHVVVVSVDFCDEQRRKYFSQFIDSLSGNSVIEWIFFENDRERCVLNSHLRPEKNAISTINLFSHIYTIPEGDVRVIPCYNNYTRT